MLDLLALLAGFATFYAVQVLRQFTAVVVPRTRVRALPAAHPTPAPYADLYVEAAEALSALGFEPLGALLLEPEPADAGTPNVAELFLHAETRTVATVQPPFEPAQPNRATVSMSTPLPGERQFVSFASNPLNAFFSSASSLRQSVATDDVEALFVAHQKGVAAHGGPDLEVPPPAFSTMADAMRQTNERHLAELVAEKKLHADRSGRLRLTLAAIPRLFLHLRRERGALYDAASPVPLPRQRALLRVFEKLRERAPLPAVQWTLLALTTVLFVALAALIWGPRFALLLAAALLLHEGGHYVAMRMFGYRNVQMVLLPLLGGVTTGIERDPDGTRRALVSLAGPLPGILLGWLLLALSSTGDASVMGLATMFGHPLAEAALVLLALNYLNLLPMPPLDGGHVLQALLPRRWAGAEIAITTVLLALGAVLFVRLQAWVLLALVVIQAFALIAQWRHARVVRALATQPAPIDDAAVLSAIDTLEPRLPFARRLGSAVQVKSLLALKSPSSTVSAALLALYLATFALPFASATVRQIAGLLLGRPPAAAIDTNSVGPPGETVEARLREQEQRLAASMSLGTAELVEGIRYSRQQLRGDAPAATSAATEFRAPAATAFDDAEAHLGITLPTGYRELAVLPASVELGVRSPEAIQRADAAIPAVLDAATAHGTSALRFPPCSAGAAPDYGRDRAGGLWLIGQLADQSAWLLYDDAGDVPCPIFHLGEDGETIAYADLHRWLADLHASSAEAAEHEQARRFREQRARAEARGLDLPMLVERLRARAAADSADAPPPEAPLPYEARAALTNRVGALPADYLQLLALGDGLRAASLWPAERVVRVDDPAAIAPLFKATGAFRLMARDGSTPTVTANRLIAPLWAIGGAWLQADASVQQIAEAASVYIARLDDGRIVYLDRPAATAYPDLQALLLDRYVSAE